MRVFCFFLLIPLKNIKFTHGLFKKNRKALKKGDGIISLKENYIQKREYLVEGEKHSEALQSIEKQDNKLSKDVSIQNEVCRNGTKAVTVSILTNTLPNSISWKIIIYPIIWKASYKTGGPYEGENQQYNTTYCLEYGLYLFDLRDYEGNGFYNCSRCDASIYLEGQLLVSIKEFEIRDKRLFHVCHRKDCSKTLESSSDGRSFGNKTAVAIHVSSLHSQTSVNPADLSNYIFGTKGKEFTMSSQFSYCSNRQFEITPFSGTTGINNVVSDGVIEVSINQNITYKTPSNMAEKVMEEVYFTYGNIVESVDFILICLPYGTSIAGSLSWKAYAFVNSYLSVYNDRNCIYPSIVMHEVGHNLGLSHSNSEGRNYGDLRCMMGLSSSEINGPNKCFNAAKSWQLGWYKNRGTLGGHITIDINDLYSGIPQLVSSVDPLFPPSVSTSDSVIMRFINNQDGNDYYVVTEYAEGYYFTTLIVRQEAGNHYKDSTIMAALNSGQSYKIALTKSGYLYVVPFGEQFSASFSALPPQDCHFKTSECSTCGTSLSVKTFTNDFPEHLTWNIKKLLSATSVVASGYLVGSYHSYIHSGCLGFGRYIFSFIYDGKNSGSQIGFEILVSETHIDNGTFVNETAIETYFIICQTDEDCFDYDGCTIDSCNNNTNLCDNTRIEESCQDCIWTSFNIVFDNFPEETKWFLDDRHGSNSILFGNPYPFDMSSVFGRRRGSTSAGRRKAPTKAGRRKAPTRSSAKEKVSDNKHRLLFDESRIFESVCLQKEFSYILKITDTFGDGICCSEGDGSYRISVENNILYEGGEFGDEEKILFRLGRCNTDQDCEDNDFMTKDVCNVEAKTCMYYEKPCNSYGVLAELIYKPVWTSSKWTVEKDGEDYITGGPYPVTMKEYTQEVCLLYGNYSYSFYNPVELFQININGTQVLHYPSEDARGKLFTICISDEDCRKGTLYWRFVCSSEHFCVKDRFQCKAVTTDECNDSLGCIPSPCGSCGKVQASFEIIAYSQGWEASWTLMNSLTFENTLSYQFVISNQILRKSYCLVPGAYQSEMKTWEGSLDIKFENMTFLSKKISKDNIFHFDKTNFHICISDEDCIIDSHCVRGVCDTSKHFCIQKQLNCTECNMQKLVVSIYHFKSYKLYTLNNWRVTEKSGKLVMMGGNYQSYNVEEKERCLPPGDYEFSIEPPSGGAIKSGVNLKLGNEIIFQEFKNSLASNLKKEFSFCSVNDDCDDGNDCTFAICRASTQKCEFYDIPYAVTVHVNTDKYFYTYSWKIYDESKDEIVMFNDNFERVGSYEKTQCLYPGEFRFVFDGLVRCGDTSCGYVVILNNNKIISASGYSSYTNETFTIDDHFSIPPSKESSFSPSLKFSPLPSSIPSLQPSICESGIVSFSVYTDDYPYETSWEIKYAQSGEVAMSGGPYLIDFTLYEVEQCLPYGAYTLTVFDDYGDGLSSCSSDTCYFKVKVDGQVMVEGTGNFETEFSEEFRIGDVDSNLTPSLAPNELLSSTSQPTSIPTSRVNQEEKVDEWYIRYKNYTAENLLSTIQLEYELAKNKASNQLISRIYLKDCITATNHSSVYIYQTDVVEQLSSIFDQGVVLIKIDDSNIRSSPYWKNLSTTQGSLDFCIKTILLTKKLEYEVTFSDTVIHTSVDFISGLVSLHTNGIELIRNNAPMIEQDTEFKVSACICDDDYECQDNSTLHQNEMFNICVKPLSEEVRVKEFHSVSISQHALRFSPIVNGEIIQEELASVIVTESVGVVKTSMIEMFFESKNPLPVNISGAVLISFKKDRVLSGIDTMLNNEAKFGTNANLASTRRISVKTSIVGAVATTVGLFFFIFLKKRDNIISYKPIKIVSDDKKC